MPFNEIFKKRFDRQIEGVIHADEFGENELFNELDEYVLTEEAKEHLQRFLDDYNGNNGNGAWLSGFFGSGKSHLLKMLALVLENREVKGQKAADVFIRKLTESDALLKGALQRAVSTPSRSILFNIDHKANTIGITDETPVILPVFRQVFDEHCGYCASDLRVAQFERELDDEGLLVSFETAFRNIAGVDWRTQGRTRIRFAPKIDEAYSTVIGSRVTDVLGKYGGDRIYSVETFAEQVKNYIDRQTPGFKLNFFMRLRA